MEKHIKDLLCKDCYTDEVEAKRVELNSIIGEFLANKTNSYDQASQEKAYWTMRSCLSLVKYATKMEHLAIAEGMYDRWKWYV